MKRLAVPIITAALLLLLTAQAAFGQDLPPGPTVKVRSNLEAANLPVQFDAIQMVLDFAPGAWTPLHSHGGEVFVTVLEGEMTVRDQAGERVYKPGDTWIEHPGDVHQAGNVGDVKASVFVTFLLPKGAQLTTVQESGSTGDLPPGPTKVYESRLEANNSPAQLDVVQMVLNFAPGAWTPLHSHGGEVLITVVAGEMTVQRQGGEMTYKAGDTWIEQAGDVHKAGNTTGAESSLAVTFLLPKGAPLTTVQDAAAPALLPQTGSDSSRVSVFWIALIATGLVAAGWFVRRKTVHIW